MAKKEINSDISVDGQIMLTNVPNGTGNFLTYNLVNNAISQRTNAEVISDLGLITATNIASAYYNKTQLQTSGQAQVHWGNLTNVPTTFTPAVHNHDDRYYTETESDAKFVPYTGATKDLNLGTNNLVLNGAITGASAIKSSGYISTNGGFGTTDKLVRDIVATRWVIGIPSTNLIYIAVNNTQDQVAMGDIIIDLFRYVGRSNKLILSSYKYSYDWFAPSIYLSHGNIDDIAKIRLLKESNSRLWIEITTTNPSQYMSTVISEKFSMSGSLNTYDIFYGSEVDTTSFTVSATILGTSIINKASTAIKLQTARTFTLGNTSKTFDGSTNVAWTLAEIGAGSANGLATLDSSSQIPNAQIPMRLVNKVIAMGGEGIDTSFTGLYDRNMLALADKEHTVTTILNGSGSIEGTIANFNDIIFNSKPNFAILTGCDSTTELVITITLSAVLDNYSRGLWQPFFQTRLSYSGTFKNCTVEVMDYVGVWYSPANYIGVNMEPLPNSGLFLFSESHPGTSVIKAIRFKFSNPSQYNGVVYLSNVGFRHVSHSFAPQFLHRGESNILFGTNTFLKSPIVPNGTLDGHAVNLEQLNTKIGNIQIGGRNLLVGSDYYKDLDTYGNGSIEPNKTLKIYNSYYISLRSTQILNITTAGYYTISFTCLEINSTNKFYIEFKNSNTGLGIYSQEIVLGKNVFTRYLSTGSYYMASFYSDAPSFDNTKWCLIKNDIKVESGNKATDWTPAPEDKQDRLQSATGNTGVGKPDTSATEKLDVNGNVKANSYKFNLPSSITAQANMLIPKTDGSRPIWYDNSSVGNDLALKSDIDNIQIGGRNLALNSEQPLWNPNNTGLGNSVKMEDSTGKFTRITANVGLTVSVYGYYLEGSNLGNHSRSMYFRPQGSSANIWGKTIPADVWTLVKDEGYTKTSGFNGFITNVGIIDVKKFKLEKGNKATDWTPAPEDQVADWNQTDVTAFNFIKNKPTSLPPTAHTHVIGDVTGLQTALDNKENTFTKNTAFNKNFGNTSGTVAEGNDSRINNGQTAYNWGNHADAGYALSGWVISNYQSLNNNLTGISGLNLTNSSVGLLKKITGPPGSNNWTLDTSVYATQTWVTNQGYITANDVPPVYNGRINYTGVGAIEGGGASTANQSVNTHYSFDLTQVTKNNINNGVTAYGWGNHSSAGYVKVSGDFIHDGTVSDYDLSTDGDTYLHNISIESSNGLDVLNLSKRHTLTIRNSNSASCPIKINSGSTFSINGYSTYVFYMTDAEKIIVTELVKTSGYT